MTRNHKYIGTWLTMKSLVISLTYFCVLVCTSVHVHVYRDTCVYVCVKARVTLGCQFSSGKSQVPSTLLRQSLTGLAGW